MRTEERPFALDRNPLNPIQLVEHARWFADEVRAGRYPYVQYDAQNRWHQRLYRDPRLDIWLISWLPSQGTQLHDHGGSAGAFAVLSGQLNEAVYRRDPASGSLTEYERTAGTAIGFGPRYVHDVRNLSDEPAVSVHAYSPPLTSMNFYDVAGDGGLSQLATLATEDPEPDLTVRRSLVRTAARVDGAI
jgi:predicted metal-dependent enzyme (double-stranded beta helix superfamily)